jgi:hypothetical protein
MSDDAIKKGTGCDWARWVWTLDRVKAHTWPHREIARYVHEQCRVRDWWTQTVTVGYERIKGLRVIGQRRGGGFEATKSKTLPVSLAKLYRAFRNAELRARWLDGVELTIRTATPRKTMRITWPGRTSVQVYFTAKGAAKSQVAIQHTGFAEREAALKMKAYWEDRLHALAQLL